MSGIGFHAPAAAWLAAAAIPLVAFYFLKLKRPRAAVTSLVLWRQVLADQRVNSPFQRFRRHLLLWLQLAALALLVLAAMQPYVDGGAAAAERRAVLIDVSASMGARRAAGGATRLDEAKAKVRAIINGLAPGQELCLIAMGAEGRRLTGFTDDRRELARALDDLTVSCSAADMVAALRLAGAMGSTQPFARAVLVSDGNLPAAIEADPPFAIDYVRVDAGGPNLGITACGALRRDGVSWEVFAAVSAAGDAGSAALELHLDGQPAQSRPVAPGPDGTTRLAFRIDGRVAATVRFALVPDAFDSLEADNQAFLHLPELKPVRAWVAAELPEWRRVLAACPDVRLVEGAAADAELVVAQRPADLARAHRVALGVGVVPPELASVVSIADQGSSTVVDARSNDALLQHLTLDDLLIAQAVSWTPGHGEAEAEGLGFTVLVHGDRGPLLVSRPTPGHASYHLLFQSARSTLPYRIAFPVMAGNLVRRVLQLGGQAEVAGLPTGVLPPVPARGEVRVTAADGTLSTVLPDGTGQVAGIAAMQPGLWRLRGAFADGVGEQVFGVALLNPAETRLAVVEQLQVREVAVATGSGGVGEWRMWPWLAALALMVLLGEWWYAHRRPALAPGGR